MSGSYFLLAANLEKGGTLFLKWVFFWVDAAKLGFIGLSCRPTFC